MRQYAKPKHQPNNPALKQNAQVFIMWVHGQSRRSRVGAVANEDFHNTGIERAIDLVSPDESELARRAKDAGSTAVALTAIAGGVAWAVILWRLVAG